ncbi:hypothetical protein GCM10009665_63030 [Kitasatospora nipponensis]|uniref:PH (Pleckstrin Homology) domain-containing protein n=1 Tax=Kitasatospora nipponensis TaxID=258049 RepID=A0ABN1WWZ1_9ACTN
MTSRAQRRRRPQPGRRAAPQVPQVDRREAKLLVKAGPTGVPPELSVRRVRWLHRLLALLVGAGVAVPVVLERCGVLRSGAPAIAGGVALLVALEMPLLHSGSRIVRHGPDGQLVSARTATGVRTVDLTALARIRRYRSPGRPGWDDELWLTDRHGVHLLSDDRRLVADLAARFGAADAAADGGRVRISRHAAHRLGLATPSRRYRFVRACVDLALPLQVPMAAGLTVGYAGWLFGALWVALG